MFSADEHKKLSVEQCRKYLKNCDYSDEQIEFVRDSLYQLANLLVDEFLKERRLWELMGKNRQNNKIIHYARELRI